MEFCQSAPPSLPCASAVQLQGAQGTGLAVGIATFVVGQQRIRLKNREVTRSPGPKREMDLKYFLNDQESDLFGDF